MGELDIGTDTLPRKAVQSVTERSSGNNLVPQSRLDLVQHARAPRVQICRAMTLQNGDNGWGHQSSPQKLLQLVGCRESKAPPE